MDYNDFEKQRIDQTGAGEREANAGQSIYPALEQQPAQPAAPYQPEPDAYHYDLAAQQNPEPDISGSWFGQTGDSYGDSLWQSTAQEPQHNSYITSQSEQQETPYNGYSTTQNAPQEPQYEAYSPQTQFETQQPVYYAPGGADTKTKEKKSKREKKRYGLGVVAVCVILSLFCGFGGAYLFGALANNAALPDDTTQAVYQPPENTQTSNGGGSANAVADVAAQNAESVVEISTETMATSSYLNNYVTQGAGSGVIYSADGYIVTCAHVVSGATNIKVTLSNGESYAAEVVGSDAVSDIALLKIDATGLRAATLGDSANLVVGQQIIVIGNPLGSLGGSVTNGIISALEREVTVSGQAMKLMQTNAAINPGNSGGAMFNERGELIGIVNAKSAGTGVEGLGFAIPINDVKPIIESIIENGYVMGRPALGVEVIDINSAEMAMQYNVSRYGVLIAGVSEGGGAQKAGIRAGDFLVSINDSAVDSVADISPILQDYEVGERVEVQVIRDNRTMSFTVTLDELGV